LDDFGYVYVAHGVLHVLIVRCHVGVLKVGTFGLSFVAAFDSAFLALFSFSFLFSSFGRKGFEPVAPLCAVLGRTARFGVSKYLRTLVVKYRVVVAIYPAQELVRVLDEVERTTAPVIPLVYQGGVVLRTLVVPAVVVVNAQSVCVIVHTENFENRREAFVVFGYVAVFVGL
jgi:hypothetical protein